jgi:hypothetical protein
MMHPPVSPDSYPQPNNTFTGILANLDALALTNHTSGSVLATNGTQVISTPQNMTKPGAIAGLVVALSLLAGVTFYFIWVFCKKNTLAVEARENVRDRWWKWGGKMKERVIDVREMAKSVVKGQEES